MQPNEDFNFSIQLNKKDGGTRLLPYPLYQGVQT